MKLQHTIIAAALIVAPSLALAAGAEQFDQSMQPVLHSYLKIQEALAGDRMTGVGAAARAIVKDCGKLDPKSVTGEHAGHYTMVPARLRQAAVKLAAAKDIAAARKAFEDLSKPMAMWAAMAKPKGVVVLYCPMAKASWLQAEGDTRNPYYGASMLHCGQMVGGGAMDHAGMHEGAMMHGEMHHAGN